MQMRSTLLTLVRDADEVATGVMLASCRSNSVGLLDSLVQALTEDNVDVAVSIEQSTVAQILESQKVRIFIVFHR